MNRSLRKAHLRRVGALIVLLPIGIGAALMSRPESSSYAAPGPTDEHEDQALFTEANLVRPEMNWTVGDGTVRVRVYAEPSGSTAVLELEAAAPIVAPDILVYWSDGGSSETVGKGLPTGASLLGSFSGSGSSSFPLPDAARREDGLVTFFSLGHGETIGFAFVESWEREQ